MIDPGAGTLPEVPDSDPDFSIYVTEGGDFVSVLPPDVVAERGLPRASIVGELLWPALAVDAITPDVFAVSAQFRDALHEFLARTTPQDERFQDEARSIGSGRITIVDHRTPTPHGAVPPVDVVGWFEVQHGRISSEAYTAGPHHHLLTDRGFFQLGRRLHARLVAELSELPFPWE